MVKRVKPDMASQILRTLSEKEFVFAKHMGDYTGEYACSLKDFFNKLQNTPLECIEFHLSPRPPDFERWIRDVLKDDYLAIQISKINRSIKGEALRHSLQQAVGDRVHELQVIAMTRVKGIGVTTSTRLVDAGIVSVEDLAHHDSTELADKIGVSERVASRWIRNAYQMASQT